MIEGLEHLCCEERLGMGTDKSGEERRGEEGRMVHKNYLYLYEKMDMYLSFLL